MSTESNIQPATPSPAVVVAVESAITDLTGEQQIGMAYAKAFIKRLAENGIAVVKASDQTGEIDRLRQQLRHAEEHIAELDSALTPLCPCTSLAMHDGPQQECPLHGDGKTFVADVRKREQIEERACEVAANAPTQTARETAQYILGETQ